MLNQALDALKSNQINLVQKEKMATLRKVVAGVAHEINNPLSFIAGNIAPICEYKNYLLELIALYQQQYSTSNPTIANFLEEVDLDFLSSDFDNIVGSIKNGAERITAVVLALRIFTRLDEAGIKQIDIHECIDTTLTLLSHRLQTSEAKAIVIHKDYGKLPPITCYAEQLNQVIFNLLYNAVDAVEAKLSQTKFDAYQPQISIHTRMTDTNQVLISIEDNGIGITEKDQARLFEPFFTTKSAGRGVGLGLAISQRIVEEIHSGSLSYRSTANVGTEFTIQIPSSPH